MGDLLSAADLLGDLLREQGDLPGAAPILRETLKIMAIDGESKWNFSPPVVTHGISESWHDLTARSLRIGETSHTHMFSYTKCL